MEEKEIAQKQYKKYGSKQLIVAVEELSELTQKDIDVIIDKKLVRTEKRLLSSAG